MCELEYVKIDWPALKVTLKLVAADVAAWPPWHVQTPLPDAPTDGEMGACDD